MRPINQGPEMCDVFLHEWCYLWDISVLVQSWIDLKGILASIRNEISDSYLIIYSDSSSMILNILKIRLF